MEINFKKDYKFWLILLVSIIIIFIIAFYNIKLNNLAYVASYDPTVNQDKYNKEFEAKEVGNEIGETFIAKYNNLKKVYVKFDELKIQDRVILSAGDGVVGVKDENGNIICEELINVQVLRLNCDYELTFPTIKDSANKTYYVYFKCERLAESGEFFKVFYTEENVLDSGELYINGEKVAGDMYFQEMYTNSAGILKITIYMFLITAILSIIAISVYYHKSITIEKLFWLIIPAICIMFLVIMPAFKSHDEGYHWFRIQDIAQGNLVTQIKDNKPIAELQNNFYEVITQKPENISYKYIINSLKNDVGDKEKIEWIEVGTTSIYNPIQYTPQTLRSSFSKKSYR